MADSENNFTVNNIFIQEIEQVENYPNSNLILTLYYCIVWEIQFCYCFIRIFKKCNEFQGLPVDKIMNSTFLF